ncbi:hypothetical protein CRG98_035849 [Punica granatum]|uniref:Uncharacterized protein n=1 Tax=Punica granatum TaxID=22663 RepID=A0A2I0IJ08_PUNGR|nr:hypothetical protein CRG98_035849 [Punica granatum]
MGRIGCGFGFCLSVSLLRLLTNEFSRVPFAIQSDSHASPSFWKVRDSSHASPTQLRSSSAKASVSKVELLRLLGGCAVRSSIGWFQLGFVIPDRRLADWRYDF